MRKIIAQKINDPAIKEADEDVPGLIKYQNIFYKESLQIFKEDPLEFLKFQTIFASSFLLNEGYREIFYFYKINDFNPSHFLTKILKPQKLQPPQLETENQNN